MSDEVQQDDKVVGMKKRKERPEPPPPPDIEIGKLVVNGATQQLQWKVQPQHQAMFDNAVRDYVRMRKKLWQAEKLVEFFDLGGL